MGRLKEIEIQSLVDEETGEVSEKPKYRSNDNYVFGQFDKDAEEVDKVSMTVPDESYTIQEILEKYTRGVLPDVSKDGEYDEVSEFDDNELENPIDITEAEEQLAVVQSRLKATGSKSVKVSKAAGSSEADDIGDATPGAKQPVA